MDKRLINYIKIGGLLAGAIFLLLAPADLFDTGQSLCLSKLLFDKECPGCGITRSIQHLIHFDFLTAWNFNKFVIIVFPVLAYLYVRQLLRWYRQARPTAAE